jgi:hypothetical protein
VGGGAEQSKKTHLLAHRHTHTCTLPTIHKAPHSSAALIRACKHACNASFIDKKHPPPTHPPTHRRTHPPVLPARYLAIGIDMGHPGSLLPLLEEDEGGQLGACTRLQQPCTQADAQTHMQGWGSALRVRVSGLGLGLGLRF